MRRRRRPRRGRNGATRRARQRRPPRPGPPSPAKVVGGSTITQQLAKNLFLGGERNFVRKAQELVLSWELEAILGKRRILEIYLNSVEWGEGVFGADAAARRYFGVGAGCARRDAGGAARGHAAGAEALREAPGLALRPGARGHRRGAHGTGRRALALSRFALRLGAGTRPSTAA